MKKYTNEHKVRIIGGKFKGTMLIVGEANGLRPTPDRIRETIFSWLEGKCQNVRVLDLFAGSGALGIESLSRGASEVILVELNAVNAQLLSSEVSKFGKSIKVINQDARAYLKQATGRFDLVFLDPPYSSDLLKDCLNILKDRQLVDENSLIYVEMNAGRSLVVSDYEVVREECSGQVKYALWKKSIPLF